MSQIKLKARRPAPGGAASSSPVGARETRQWFQLNNGRDLPSARSVGGFGGSRRFFGPSRGNPVVLAPGIGRKIAAHTGGKAASPIRGDIQGGSPLGSLLHPFLERKGCARPGMRGYYRAGGESPQPDRATYRWRKSRCGAMGNLVAGDAAKPRMGAVGNKNAGDAAVSQIKLRARLAAR